jgi:DNA-binding CsgD family transcriptional regulator
MLQQGRSNQQIAVALHVGVETVRTHASNIYRKLGVASRRELSRPAARVRSRTLVQPSPTAHQSHGIGRS